MSPQIPISTFKKGTFSVYLVIVLFALAACSSKSKSPESTGSASAPQSSTAATPTQSAPNLETTDAVTAKQTIALALPKNFGRATGDWDQIVKRGALRVLVINNRTGFFYDKGQPRGAIYEGLEEFQKFTNKKLNRGTLSVKVTYLPMAPAQVEAALTEGMGDLVANAVFITPEREAKFAVSTPIQTNVTQIVVSGPAFSTFSNLEQLGGKEIFVNPLTVAYEDLQKVNAALTKPNLPD